MAATAEINEFTLRPGRLPIDSLVNEHELARAYDVDLVTIGKWIAEGMPCKERDGIRLILVSEFFEWFHKPRRAKRLAK